MTEVFAEPAPSFREDTLLAALREHWSSTFDQVRFLDSERDLNVLAGDYVLKISNPAEAADIVSMEVDVLAHIHSVDPDFPVPTVIPADSGAVVRLRDDSGRDCLTRLITLLPGSPLEGKPVSPALAAQIGAIAGRTSVALHGFFHPAARRELLWDIRRLANDRVRSALAALPSGENPRALVDRLVEQGVLAGMTGPRGDVLKIRPPLVWDFEHVDEFVTRLGRALG